MQLDRALEFKDADVHEMALFAIDGLLTKGQLPNGGFPQVYPVPNEHHDQLLAIKASFPQDWSRTYQGHQSYWYRYTLNDNLASDVAETLFLAEKIYGDEKYREAAIRLGDFLIKAQLPDPQPAWAQQYSYQMHPIWARKFEPPAITDGESQDVIKTLLMLYRETGKPEYLHPAQRALEYLKKSEIKDGVLARFYELQTNRPLYFTKDYQLTYDNSDVPTHYAFQVKSRIGKLWDEYLELRNQGRMELANLKLNAKVSKPNAKQVRQIIADLDERGAWVSNTGLRYHKKPGEVIKMRSTVKNLLLLADFLIEK